MSSRSCERALRLPRKRRAVSKLEDVIESRMSVFWHLADQMI
jgi:hypothetical protein